MAVLSPQAGGAGVALLIADRLYRSSVDIKNINETIIMDDDREKPSRMDIHIKMRPEDVGARVKESKELVKYRISVCPFTEENVEAKIAIRAAERITSKYAILKGKNSIINLDSKNRTVNVNLILTGSVDRLGNIYMISVKVVNVEDGKAFFIGSENVDSMSEIDAVCDRIAERIVRRIEQMTKVSLLFIFNLPQRSQRFILFFSLFIFNR
ncbi:MAG: hypothetical protein SVZ03_09445 [Spirochaetota bacterium]|nr:hypothetical protein [Spirochaetota bacterium]